MATRDTLRRLVPAMASVSDDDCDSWIADAVTETDSTVWPESVYPRAVCYLAGHLYLRTVVGMSGAGAGAGAVLSESAGGMSRSYGPGPSGVDAELMTTAAGMEYLRLRKAHFAAPYYLEPDDTHSLR